MKKTLLIGTGGTIVSKEGTNGLIPVYTINELLESIPEIKEICIASTIQLCNIDSTNITPYHWLEIAKVIEENYDTYDSFVITHGTDTLAYTASGLNYLIQNSLKPIVLTGAQKPIFEDGSDGKRNLIDSFIYANDDESHGVSIVFYGKVIAGTRARKNYTKNFMAFTSINFPLLAEVSNGIVRRIEKVDYNIDTKFYHNINPNVGLLKLVPGLRDDVMEYIISHYDALIVECFGLGGLPEYSNYFGKIEEGIKQGKLFLMTTQVPYEGSDFSTYHVGNRVKKSLNVLEAHDMTLEASLAKLMWLLGNADNYEKQEEMFYNEIGFDIEWRKNENFSTKW